MKQETPSAPSVIEMTPTSGALYPELLGQGALPDQSYRLQEISRIREHLEAEREKRAQLEKKVPPRFEYFEWLRHNSSLDQRVDRCRRRGPIDHDCRGPRGDRPRSYRFALRSRWSCRKNCGPPPGRQSQKTL